jgi:hypothetical protein
VAVCDDRAGARSPRAALHGTALDVSVRQRIVGLLVLAVLAAAGIVFFAGGSVDRPSEPGGPFPAACGNFGFAQPRCYLAMRRAAAIAKVDLASVTTIKMLQFQPSGVSLGGREMAVFEFDLPTQTTVRQELWCSGISSGSDRVCDADPQIGIATGVDRDVPCSGDTPPAGCATLPPSPRPASVAAAHPLVLATVNVPLDHDGHYEVDLGAASLPDGVLSERSAELADSRPTTFWIDSGIRIDVRPDVAGRPPIGNIYRDPFDGPEPVHVYLVFDASDVQPGATLEIRDLVVR